jgi:hypothetical protein
MRALLAAVLVSFASAGNCQPQPLPIFDAHLHYSHDAWDTVPVEQAIDIMRKAGLKRALISSSGDEGQQRLYRAAPDLVIPELRPYRTRGEIGTWVRDETVVAYLERVAELLRKYRNLWCDLAFRTDHASGGKVDPAWRSAFLQFPDRFMVGTDSYTPERWHYIPGHADWSRQWLADLPRDVAERIAWKNGEEVFGSLLQPH